MLFFGLISIREFQYRFKNSIAYYEILTLDAPYTDYDHTKDKKTPPVVIDDDAIRLNKEAQEERKNRKI